jgi:hypothetical protein
MFAGAYFPKAYFAGTYFPPAEGGAPPVIPPPISYGHRPMPASEPWPVEFDDDELMFWIL